VGIMKNDDFPKFNLKEIDKDIKRNKKARMEFIHQYTKWLKKTPNKEWSKQQNKLLSH
jgi:hypothetical protein